ncbi:Bystin-domain-containing protein, partial [Ramicandelaber brevisporus]
LDGEGDAEAASAGYVDAKSSKRILELARKQQAEIEAEDGSDDEDMDAGADAPFAFGDDDDDDDYEEDEEEYEIEDIELDDEEQAVLDRFLPEAPRERQSLADLIMSKIKRYELKQESDARILVPPNINEKVAAVYTQVGGLLSRYTHGRLPKAFKIIPSIPNWEDILYLTNPSGWTPHAMFAATKVFISNMKPKAAQKFLQYVLLDAVRADIQEHKKLNYHLYMALKKAVYKPSAFFKGIVFPLCESGTCTLREAVILGSVLTRVSIPMLHSAGALYKLAEMDYTGPTSLFIRVLIDKKYALPYKVVDALVFHFTRFKNDERAMPVLWHQSFLAFVQRYKADIAPDQKDALMEVLRVKTHHSISPEIRRELVNSVSRGELVLQPDGAKMDLD